MVRTLSVALLLLLLGLAPAEAGRGAPPKEVPVFGTIYREAAKDVGKANPWYLHEMAEGRVVRKLRLLFADAALEKEVDTLGEVENKASSAIIERAILLGVRGKDTKGKPTFMVTDVVGVILRG